MKKKSQKQGKAKDHRYRTECVVHSDRTDRIRIPYGNAVRKLSGIVLLYKADIPCVRSTTDRRYLYDHLSDLPLYQGG